jgi:hypothetical protein
VPATKPLVNFLIAGVQKGGTSALFGYLHEIAGVQMSSIKEPHFFDDDTIDWSTPDYALYHRHFAASDAVHVGEATPNYIYWPNALERIRRYNPDMKLVFLFRNPVLRAWSAWRMQFARRQETKPFAWCIRKGRSRVAESRDPPGFHRIYSYVERGFYGRQMEHVFRLFDRSQVLVLRSGELRNQADRTVRRVCRFIGAPEPAAHVPNRIVFSAKRIDYGSFLTADDAAYLRSIYRQDLMTFQEITGMDVSRWISGPTQRG